VDVSRQNRERGVQWSSSVITHKLSQRQRGLRGGAPAAMSNAILWDAAVNTVSMLKIWYTDTQTDQLTNKPMQSHI